MEEEILKSLLLRPGMDGKEELLKDLITDSIQEMRNYLNYAEEEALSGGCIGAVKMLVLIRLNQDGAEGIQSESMSSGGSTTYTDALSDSVKRTIKKYRRLPR